MSKIITIIIIIIIITITIIMIITIIIIIIIIIIIVRLHACHVIFLPVNPFMFTINNILFNQRYFCVSRDRVNGYS